MCTTCHLMYIVLYIKWVHHSSGTKPTSLSSTTLFISNCLSFSIVLSISISSNYPLSFKALSLDCCPFVACCHLWPCSAAECVHLPASNGSWRSTKSYVYHVPWIFRVACISFILGTLWGSFEGNVYSRKYSAHCRIMRTFKQSV